MPAPIQSQARSQRQITLDRIERELNRLRASRPNLDRRISTAEAMLVTQLSVSPAVRPIKVHLTHDGHVYRVRSNSKLGLVYDVNPVDWSCDCRWQANGNSGCSHSIACFVLEQVAGRTRHRTHRSAGWGIPNQQVAANLARMGG